MAGERTDGPTPWSAIVDELAAAGFADGREVGRGASGKVYRCYQTSLGRTVAIKVLADSLAHDESVKERFLREARARFGSRFIPRKEFIFDLMSRADKARTYALIADQTPKEKDPKQWTHFLNQETAFFTGAGKIAQFLDATVLYVSMRRLRRGYYSVRLSEIGAPPYDQGADTLIVERYARCLEQDIRDSPADWLWLQKKWKYAKALD